MHEQLQFLENLFFLLGALAGLYGVLGGLVYFFETRPKKRVPFFMRDQRKEDRWL